MKINEIFDIPRQKRSRKSGPYQSKAIGSRVRILGGPQNGEEGVIIGASREPTFSQMVPYVTLYRIKLDSNDTAYINKKNVRMIKTSDVDRRIHAQLQKLGHSLTKTKRVKQTDQ